jgi:hypothetical protein
MSTEAYEAAIQAKLALGGPRCRHRCQGIDCEFPENHSGLHLTTKEGGFGWWASKHSDPPTYWDRLFQEAL